MDAIEIVLLIITYTLIIITIFLEIVCYKRNLETIETIAFTFSLLLLIISLSISSFLEHTNQVHTINIFTLFAMILVGLTTPLNILEERQHNIPLLWKKLLIVLSIILVVCLVIAQVLNGLIFFQYSIIAFLGISVVLSMTLILNTKPQKRIVHREKIDRKFSLAFILLIPFSLFLNYAFEAEYSELKIGFTIPIIFILLSGSKFMDDLQRLSLFDHQTKPNEQHFKNYSLTDREQEISLLLAKGKSYKEIAEDLFISLPTVKTHTTNIYRKCGVKSRFELISLLIN